jgi:hypothetical protein
MDMTWRRAAKLVNNVGKATENTAQAKAARDKAFGRSRLMCGAIIFVRCEADASENGN